MQIGRCRRCRGSPRLAAFPAGSQRPQPRPWHAAWAPTRAGYPYAELPAVRCSSRRGDRSAPRRVSRRGSGVKLRQRRRWRRRPREELQEEERRRQRVRFSAATLSQARLVPPPPGASALAPRLPPTRRPARDRPEGGATRAVAARRGEARVVVFPRHPPLDAPQPAPGPTGQPPLRKETTPVRPPPASSAAVP